MKDYYAILGVSRSASPAQVRLRFLELARGRHPDRYQATEKAQAETDFQALTEAFNVLSNPDRRRQHDAELSRAGRPQAASAPGAGAPSASAKVFLARGTQAYKDRQWKDAILHFEEATRADGTNATAHHALALAAYQAQDLRRAMAAIARACELDPRSGKYLKLAGRVFAQGGLPAKAERYYREALQWLGDDPEVGEALAILRGRSS